LPPDIYSINDEISVIITFLIWRREFFLAAQREAVFSNGGCEVLECRSTTYYLHLNLYTISKEPMYKGELCAILDTFPFSQFIVVEAPFHAHLINIFLH
jgi:hypothetical protein